MYDLLLINACIITVDGAHSLYPDGYLATEGDRIAAIGPMEELEGGLPQAKRLIDMSGHAVLPGLVDGHGHAGHCLTKTLGEHLAGNETEFWTVMAEDVYYRSTDEEFWYAEGALAAAERIKFGTTTGVSMVGSTPRIDWIDPVGANLDGSTSVGIRQLSGIGSANPPWPKTAKRFYPDGTVTERNVDPNEALRSTEEALKAFNGRHPLQTCIVAPGKMGFREGISVEDNVIHNRTMFRLSEEYGVPLHTHAFGGDVQFLHDTSPEVLTPNLSLTHSTGYSEQELDILADTGAWVFHGPTTNGHMYGHCRVMEMLEKGIHVAVVTDGTSPDRSFDLWRDMKTAQFLQRFRFKTRDLLPCGKMLEMVTIEPAKALGIADQVGSLEVGKKADIIAVDVMQPHLAPFGVMPVQRLVYHAMGQDVDWAIVDGKIVMEERRLVLADEKAIMKRAADAFELMMKRLNQPELLDNPDLYGIRQGFTKTQPLKVLPADV